jgi:hypothetical protein
VAARAYLILTTRATEEDFYITLRYARNLAGGLGFAYNPGEHVLGSTTPLYTLFLALCIRLHVDPVIAGKGACVVAEALSCWIVWRLGLRLNRPIAGLLAAILVAVAPLNLIESVKGMEASLVACACIGAWACWAERRETGAWVCAALVTLLRIDGALLAVILLGASLARDRRPPWRSLAVYAALVAPWLVYATVVFGSPVPTSLRAKLVVYGWHSSERFPNLGPFLRIMTHNPLSAALFAGALLTALFAVAGLMPRRSGRATNRPDVPPVVVAMLAWLAIYYGGMALSKVFLFGWYFLPPAPTYYLVACTGWTTLAAAFRPVEWRKHPRRLAQGTAAALLLGALAAALTVPRAATTLRESQRAETELRIPIGEWLKQHAAPTGTVMLEPIGYIGYVSGLRVLDTVGLVSPQVLPFYRAEEPSPYHALWQAFRPEWVLLRAGEQQEIEAYERTLPPGDRLEAAYRPVQSWRAPGSGPGGPPAFLLYRRLP